MTGETTAGEPLAETAKTAWKLDALWQWRHDVDTKIRHILDKAMATMGIRGPDPDAEGENDFERGVRFGSMYGSNGYREAPKENGVKAIIIGCTITILSTGIIAAFVLANQFSEFRGQVSEWQKSTERRLEMLEHRP